ncbi:hypothetical protein GCM10025877_30770 [Agromyces mangrovi Wang et al. 2018]|nr:hypothetical protein GCM10025877_30770 [Agromyces mangrovi]
MSTETDTGTGTDTGTETGHTEDHGIDLAGRALDLDRALEAILFVADEPQTVVQLATAVARPVREVRASITRLVADYDGETGSGARRPREASVAASNCARSAAAGGSTCAATTTIS